MEKVVDVGNENQPNRGSVLSQEESQRSDDADDRYVHDSQHLLSIFPKEIWDHICSFLDAVSFLNLNNSSSLFRQLFLRKRVEFLYKPVLEILLLNFGEPKTNDLQGRLVVRHTKLIVKFLGTSRLVCKMWKRAIDEMASLWNGNTIVQNNAVEFFLHKSYTFYQNYNLEKIYKFLEHFNSTHPPSVCPFIGKSFYIQFQTRKVPNFLGIFDEISGILEKYGRHLQTFELDVELANASEPELHRRMINLLNHMPNLDAFKIHCRFLIESNNPPNLNVQVVPSRITNLTKLIVKTESNCNNAAWSWIDHYNLGQLIRTQNKLEHLEMTMHTPSDSQILKELKSPLKVLVALYDCRVNNINISDLFTSYSENFSNCLESLTVAFRWSCKSRLQFIKNVFNVRLYLPKVKTFRIKITSELSSLDFLLGMKDNLEWLKVEYLAGRPVFNECEKFRSVDQITIMEDKQIIKFLGFQNKMLESNIWSLFPKLKVILLVASEERMEYNRLDWMKTEEMNQV